jgi:hypothetical protein
VAKHLEPETVERICRELDYRWRERILGPVATVHAFLLQVLHGNMACDRVPHLMGKRFTGEAYAQARARLPLEPQKRIQELSGAILKSPATNQTRRGGKTTGLATGSQRRTKSNGVGQGSP